MKIHRFVFLLKTRFSTHSVLFIGSHFKLFPNKDYLFKLQESNSNTKNIYT